MAPILPLLLLVSVPQEAPPAPPPAPERGVRVHVEGAFEGYTLFAPLRSASTFLIDMEGNEVFGWQTTHPPMSAYLMDDGGLLECSRIDENPVFFGGGIGGRMQELDWEGKVLWEFVLSDAKRCQHHDIEPLPNGNVLAIAWESLSREEAIALGRDPAQVNERGFWPDAVFEIRPTQPSGGEIVWEWHARDHLIQDADRARPGYGSIPEHPGRIDINADHRDRPPLSEEERARQEELAAQMAALGYTGGSDDAAGKEPDAGAPPRPPGGDWLHTNAIDYHAGHDLILLSVPRLNEIWVIDHSTTSAEARGSTGGRRRKGGDLLYRWGNPRNYGRGSDADRALFGQHDAQWIPDGCPGAGHVTVFNNGEGRAEKGSSSVDELALPFDPAAGFTLAPGKAFGPEKPAWSYRDPERFFSFFISGCQRLPNGNTLICSGAQGRFFEVTPGGEIVWEYWNPHGGEIPASFGRAAPQGPSAVDPKAVFRATRIAPDHPGLKALGVTQQ